MLVGKPILSGESDAHQLELIWDLMGSPTDENMPGWRKLPGGHHLTPRPRSGNLPSRFREFGHGAIGLLKELLKLDWRTRTNAADAIEHPYFQMLPLPLRPSEIPTFEESHELDRRKFHDRKANLPPAPKGGTVGIGPDANGATAGFNSSDPYGRNGANGGRFRDDRRPAWQRERGPPASRPPPARDDRSRPLPPRGGGGDVDTYIPSYRGPPDDRSRDDRRAPRPAPRDERRQDRPPRNSRSRSPNHDRARERDRERERAEIYRR